MTRKVPAIKRLQKKIFTWTVFQWLTRKRKDCRLIRESLIRGYSARPDPNTILPSGQPRQNPTNNARFMLVNMVASRNGFRNLIEGGEERRQ